jgi:hypothetical protein
VAVHASKPPPSVAAIPPKCHSARPRVRIGCSVTNTDSRKSTRGGESLYATTGNRRGWRLLREISLLVTALTAIVAAILSYVVILHGSAPVGVHVANHQRAQSRGFIRPPVIRIQQPTLRADTRRQTASPSHLKERTIKRGGRGPVDGTDTLERALPISTTATAETPDAGAVEAVLPIHPNTHKTTSAGCRGDPDRPFRRS